MSLRNRIITSDVLCRQKECVLSEAVKNKVYHNKTSIAKIKTELWR